VSRIDETMDMSTIMMEKMRWMSAKMMLLTAKDRAEIDRDIRSTAVMDR
jgi:hypothetical protein